MTRTFYDRNAFKILLIATLLLGPTLIGAFRALKSNKNEVADWLPEQYAETTTFKWFRKHFANEQFILASWDGCTLDDQRLRLMTAKLVPPPPTEPPAWAHDATNGKKDGKPPPRYFKDEVVSGRMLLERL